MDLIAREWNLWKKNKNKKDSKAGLGLAEVQHFFYREIFKKKKKKMKHERVRFCLECVHLETVIDRFFPSCVNQLLNWALPYNVTHPPTSLNTTKISPSFYINFMLSVLKLCLVLLENSVFKVS